MQCALLHSTNVSYVCISVVTIELQFGIFLKQALLGDLQERIDRGVYIVSLFEF